MTAIIFGAGGQDGFYLTELLTEKRIYGYRDHQEKKILLILIFQIIHW